MEESREVFPHKNYKSNFFTFSVYTSCREIGKEIWKNKVKIIFPFKFSIRKENLRLAFLIS